MGYDVKAWLTKKVFGSGPVGKNLQPGASNYVQPKSAVTKKLDEAGDIRPAPRRGDDDGEYDPYIQDRNIEPEDKLADE